MSPSRRRRQIVAAAVVVAALAAAAGCTRSNVRATPNSAPPSRPPGACTVGDVGAAESASTLTPGPSNGLPNSDAKGDRLVIDGLVLDTGCNPLAGAQLNIWHTDARGDYGPRGTEKCCYYQGSVLTDPFGRFRLDTVRPAQYPQPNAPPAHVHLEIRHSFKSLGTEITFIDSSGPPIVSGSGVVPVQLSRVRETQGDTWRGKVAFVLPG